MANERPTIVCLCGSTRFKQAFIAANFRETMAGKIVLSVGLYGHADGDVYAPSPAEKEALDELHLRKIDLADEVLILNCKVPWCDRCGTFRTGAMGCPGECAWGGTLRPYIGESTKRELEHARAGNKIIRFLEPEV